MNEKILVCISQQNMFYNNTDGLALFRVNDVRVWSFKQVCPTSERPNFGIAIKCMSTSLTV